MIHLTTGQIDFLMALKELGGEANSFHIGLKCWEMGGAISPSQFIQTLHHLEERGIIQRNRESLISTFRLTSEGEQVLADALAQRQMRLGAFLQNS